MPKHKSRCLNQEHPPSFDLLDEATNCCDKIEAVAQLLATCQSQHLRKETVSVAGALIMDEAVNLRQHLDTLLRIRHPHQPAKMK